VATSTPIANYCKSSSDTAENEYFNGVIVAVCTATANLDSVTAATVPSVTPDYTITSLSPYTQVRNTPAAASTLTWVNPGFTLPADPTGAAQAFTPNFQPLNSTWRLVRTGFTKTSFGLNMYPYLAVNPDIPYPAVRLFVHWSNMASKSGSNPVVYNFDVKYDPATGSETFRQAMNRFYKAGSKIDIVLLDTPAYAQLNPSSPATPGGVPGSSSLFSGQDAANFLKALIKTFPSMIRSIELWNEANLKVNTTDNRGYFSGSIEDLVTVCREMYEAIKETDSTITVVSPSFLYPGGAAQSGDADRYIDDYVRRFGELGGFNWCDVLALHYYLSDATLAVTPKGSIPDNILIINNSTWNVYKMYGDIWITEAGTLGGANNYYSADRALSQTIQNALFAFINGASQYDFYNWVDDSMSTDVAARMQSSTKLKYGWAQLMHDLDGLKLVSRHGNNFDDLQVVKLVNSSGQNSYLAWTNGKPFVMNSSALTGVTKIKKLNGTVTIISDNAVPVTAIPVLLTP
jgi:hypothetical protein